MDLPKHAFFKGKIVPYSEAKVGVLTHALNYGTAAFGGIRAYWNESEQQLFIFRPFEHYQRLLNSAKLLMMELRAHLEARGDAWRRRAHDGAGNGAAGDPPKFARLTYHVKQHDAFDDGQSDDPRHDRAVANHLVAAALFAQARHHQHRGDRAEIRGLGRRMIEPLRMGFAAARGARQDRSPGRSRPATCTPWPCRSW